ncbi:MAG: DegV family protein [Candidatus Faecalibacterium intestinavium]|uniref:DegV family protein n=1 Tax=Candidatus Faecalibacterium intestinavium TaxID=2838580 RepID=A0A9E2NRI1_9FIRM|nr:DegV family protein [Candidatus Faecalibacterium intestinavium]
MEMRNIMSKIAILTDSSCDIPQELAEKYGIDIMSFHITLDDVDYLERVSCTSEEFYDLMRKAKGVPSTAALTPIQFCEKYCEYVDAGYTDVIHVTINSGGSSTYNNAMMAKNMLREERPEHQMKIHLVDSHTYSMVFGWYVCEMARKLRNGAELRHVVDEFNDKMNRAEIILGPYSLKQMKKSGRISAAAAFAGELLGLRPIISMVSGKTSVVNKVRGDDKVVPAMVEACKKRVEGLDDVEYLLGYTGIEQIEDLKKACRKAFGHDPVNIFLLGGVVSANTGPDTLAIAFLGHPRG